MKISRFNKSLYSPSTMSSCLSFIDKTVLKLDINKNRTGGHLKQSIYVGYSYLFA